MTHGGRIKPCVLLTGFGPFPTVATNASAMLVEDVAAVLAAELVGWTVTAVTLPTGWVDGPRALEAALVEHAPLIAVHFGVSRRARGFEIESRARNRAAFAPDASGRVADSRQLVVGGPDTIPVTIPSVLIVEHLRARGLPAQLSRNAGEYICNAVLYRSLMLSRQGAIARRVGFVHVPTALAPNSTKSSARSPLSWDEAVAGAALIVRSSLAMPHVGPMGDEIMD